MNAKSIVLSLFVGFTLVAAQNRVRLTPEAAKAIFHNLHQIAAGAEQYYHENQKAGASIDELVGPRKFIKRLVAVADEDYRTLILKRGVPVVLTMPSGETIAVDPLRSEEATYAFHKVRRGDTVEYIAAATKTPVERLRALNPDMKLEQLEASDAVRIR